MVPQDALTAVVQEAHSAGLIEPTGTLDPDGDEMWRLTRRGGNS
jgi:hypothetical protein